MKKIILATESKIEENGKSFGVMRVCNMRRWFASEKKDTSEISKKKFTGLWYKLEVYKHRSKHLLIS